MHNIWTYEEIFSVYAWLLAKTTVKKWRCWHGIKQNTHIHIHKYNTNIYQFGDIFTHEWTDKCQNAVQIRWTVDDMDRSKTNWMGFLHGYRANQKSSYAIQKNVRNISFSNEFTARFIAQHGLKQHVIVAVSTEISQQPTKKRDQNHRIQTCVYFM